MWHTEISNLLCVKIYGHQDHYLVEIWNDSHPLSQFFVSHEESDAFFATWYPDFIRTVALVMNQEKR
jgi:hypothetical protein